MISDSEKISFSFVKEQFKKGNIALMETTEKGSDKRAVIMCFKTVTDTGVELIPFARMLNEAYRVDDNFDAPQGSEHAPSTVADFLRLKL